MSNNTAEKIEQLRNIISYISKKKRAGTWEFNYVPSGPN